MSAWARPVHHCLGCGVEGRLSLADPDPADARPVLKLAWGGPNGKAQLLCSLCEPSEAIQPEPVNG
jgi:hypothetical protein